jgi:hypothetical protein
MNKGMEDEYAVIARSAFASYCDGTPVLQAIVQELNFWFGEDLMTEKKKQQILHALSKRVACS